MKTNYRLTQNRRIQKSYDMLNKSCLPIFHLSGKHAKITLIKILKSNTMDIFPQQ